MKNKVIILSGGLDSTVLLYEMVKTFGVSRIKALNFAYGSKHNKEELKRAIRTCSRLGVSLSTVDIDLNTILKSDLLKSGGDIPEGHYEDSNMIRTVVPFRNGIMLAIATGFAESNNADKVFIGNHSGDHAVYPDCRATFISSMNEAMAYGTYAGVNLKAPFVGLSKADIVSRGEIFKVDFLNTYSCYKGGNIHCGVCSTCYERREAFYLAEVSDPTDYLDRTPISKMIEDYEALKQ